MVAEVLAQGREYAAAVDHLLAARRRSGDELIHADRLIDIYDKAGRPTEAVREVVRVLNRQPQALAGMTQRIEALAGRGGPGLIGELERLADDKVRVRAQAAVYLALGREAEAVRVLQPVLSDQELYVFGHDAEGQGRLEAALAIYRSQKAHADAARVLRLQGKPRDALAELSNDDGPGARFELAELLSEQGDYPAAAQAYRAVLSRRPNQGQAVTGLATALLRMGKTAEARSELQRARTTTDQALLLFARSFLYEGRMDSAAEFAGRLVRQFPQSVLANDALEMMMLPGSGERATELARLMLEYEAGKDAAGRTQSLARGDDVVAEHALVLFARFLRRSQKSREALAALDEYARRFPQGQLGARVALERAYVFRDDLKDESGYRDALQALIVGFPGSPWVSVARGLLSAPGTGRQSGPMR
jgi:tetratricopeptide (TPR) repeat protein